MPAARRVTPTFETIPMLAALVAALLFLAFAGFDTTFDPPLPKAKKVSPTWYVDAVRELTALDREAEKMWEAGKGNEAAALLLKGKPLVQKVLGIPRPTLEATIAASDLDHLYGRMLFSNKNYGWARLQFQKNLARWKYWKPATPESERRLQQARDAIADCDRQIKQ